MQAQQGQQNYGNQMILQKGVHIGQNNGNLGTETGYVKGSGVIGQGTPVQFH